MNHITLKNMTYYELLAFLDASFSKEPDYPNMENSTAAKRMIWMYGKIKQLTEECKPDTIKF